MPDVDPEVTLRHGRTSVVVQGGDQLGLRSWAVDGVELLADPAALPPHYRVHGRRAGVAFLHPWANRVGSDAFELGGREVRVGDDPAVSRDPAGLAIHGLAEPGAWVPEARGEDACAVRREVAPTDAFPFAHTVEVDVRVQPGDRVEVTTAVTAEADGPLPVAFGWHPYFVLPQPRPEWLLALPERTRLELDDLGLPTGRRTPELAEQGPLRDRSFDDGYVDVPATSWSIGPATLELGPGYDVGQVFAPPDCDVVSLEPMTAPTDALRTRDRLRCLSPGERFSATFVLAHQG